MNETPATPTPADSGECERLRDRDAKLRDACRRAEMSIMETSGEWYLCDTSERGKELDQQTLDVATKNVDLELEVERLRAELVAAVGVLARLPHTADGVPVICDGMTLFCPKGHANKMSHAHHRVYCTTGECWNDGCQGDSGSGTGYSFDKCYATAKGGGA